ncbi:MAG: glycosyltransferase [Luteibaculaceae bacterium]
MKILIITYYWPPNGGAGVFRWLKLSKYLSRYNDLEIFIYTPLNGEAQFIDPTLEKEVSDKITIIKSKIYEPFSIYKLFLGLKQSDKIPTGFLETKKSNRIKNKIAVWIRSNFFIPDAKFLWINPSVKLLKKHIKDNKIDWIISTGPPHSTHLIALKLKEQLNIKWLADFRDPWTNIDWFSKLKLTSFAKKKHEELELSVITTADKVITVSPTWAKELQQIGTRPVEVIHNGYDNEDLIPTNSYRESPDSTKNKKITLLHTGSLNADRNPKNFWHSLKNIIDLNKEIELEVKLIGPVDNTVFEIIHELQLKKIVKHIKLLSHSQTLQEILNADILLLLLNRTKNNLGIIPGKLYEYMQSKKPILAIGDPRGDSADIIKECNLGEIIDFETIITEEKLLAIKNLKIKLPIAKTEKYSREFQAKKIREILYKNLNVSG